MRSGIPTNTRRSLRRRSPAKWKHLGLMGTPVWCLPWALRCLSVLSGPGCSGRPGRVGCLGYPVDSEQQDAMGVTGKGATVPIRAGDRRMVVSDGIGARLVSAMKEEGGSKRPMLVLVLLPGSRCSEHYSVRAHGLFRRGQGRWSAKDPVPGERPALNTAEYCQRQYFVVGEYVDINTC
ncbi:hypothetical protein TIFTF001_012318 [Ficus carica]|uniref:Uncharacterized protein n=1 Tax=Ficus carica TaxID=3494 RepID=A0AA88A1G8_FICCA|nr:hypothetical protein TIFTF001_012318 [Ficus carica]